MECELLAIAKMDILYMFYHFQDPIKVIRRYEGCHYTRLESYYIIFYFETDWSRIRPLPSTTLIIIIIIHVVFYCVGFPIWWCIPSMYVLCTYWLVVVYPLGSPAYIHCMQHTLIPAPTGDCGSSLYIRRWVAWHKDTSSWSRLVISTFNVAG